MSSPNQKPQRDLSPVLDSTDIARRLEEYVANGDDASVQHILNKFKFGNGYLLPIIHAPGTNTEEETP